MKANNRDQVEHQRHNESFLSQCQQTDQMAEDSKIEERSRLLPINSHWGTPTKMSSTQIMKVWYFEISVFR